MIAVEAYLRHVTNEQPEDPFFFDGEPRKFRLGDSVFWRNFEDIPVIRIFQVNSSEYRQVKLIVLEIVLIGMHIMIH